MKKLLLISLLLVAIVLVVLVASPDALALKDWHNSPLPEPTATPDSGPAEPPPADGDDDKKDNDTPPGNPQPAPDKDEGNKNISLPDAPQPVPDK